jgi:uncharacterized protein (TIGR02266 family)
LATTNSTRQANRSPVTLKIKFKSETLNQFIERYSVDISHGGIFIRTKDPLPVGTALRFEFQLKDASPLITGDGTVVWTREFDPTRSGVAPGMGVRFDRLPAESQEILDQILAYKTAKMGGGDNGAEVPPFLDVPTKVNPGGQAAAAQPFGEVPTRVTPAHVLKNLQQGEDPRRTLIGIGMSQLKSNGGGYTHTGDDKTPLPRPMPFHADLDEFPDEAFEEATKVAALEALAKKAEEDDDSYRASMDDDVTMQRSKRPTAPAPEAMAAAVASMPGRESGADIFSLREDPPRLTEMPHPLPDDEEDSAGDDAGGFAASASQPQMSEYRPPPQVAVPMQREEVEQGGSSLPWIIAAAVVLVVASIGGFLLLSGKDEKDKTAKTQPTPAPTPAKSVTPDPAPAITPPAPGLELVVKSTPEGAMAELVGESQSGVTPMTFRGLEKGKKYKVKLSQNGFVEQEIEVEAGGDEPKPVVLVAKPIVLKVTSVPPGAAVFIDGQKQRHVTPATIPIGPKMAAKKQFKLSVRRTGYNNADQAVALDSLVDSGENMAQEVAVTMVKRQVVRPSGGGAKPTGDKPAGDKPAGDTPAGDTPAGDKPAGDSPAGDKPAGDTPSGDKPAPEPASDKPAEEKSSLKGGTKPEPTPEWTN